MYFGVSHKLLLWLHGNRGGAARVVVLHGEVAAATSHPSNIEEVQYARNTN